MQERLISGIETATPGDFPFKPRIQRSGTGRQSASRPGAIAGNNPLGALDSHMWAYARTTCEGYKTPSSSKKGGAFINFEAENYSAFSVLLTFFASKETSSISNISVSLGPIDPGAPISP